jgi:hypothetical protein
MHAGPDFLDRIRDEPPGRVRIPMMSAGHSD